LNIYVLLVYFQVSKNQNSLFQKQDCTNTSHPHLTLKEEPDSSRYDSTGDERKSSSYNHHDALAHQNQYTSSSSSSLVGMKIKTEDKDKRYGPDFNELMEDDSPNNLEIDMSDDGGREDGSKTKEENNNKIDSVDIKDQHVFAAAAAGGGPRHVLLSNGGSKMSSLSAFRPVTSDTKDMLSGVAMSPLGPYPPVGATFVGYPDNAGITSPEKEQTLSLNGDKQTSNICLLQPKARTKTHEKLEEAATATLAISERRSIESPDTKEYTILQPANSTSKTNNSSETTATTSAPSATTVTSNFDSSSSQSPQTDILSKGKLYNVR
jgi:hypothetical protein